MAFEASLPGFPLSKLLFGNSDFFRMPPHSAIPKVFYLTLFMVLNSR